MKTEAKARKEGGAQTKNTRRPSEAEAGKANGRRLQRKRPAVRNGGGLRRKQQQKLRRRRSSAAKEEKRQKDKVREQERRGQRKKVKRKKRGPAPSEEVGRGAKNY